MRRKQLVPLAIFTVLMSGCGTVCNLAGGQPQPYGGVAKDVEFAAARQGSLENEPQHPGVSGHSPLVLAGILGLCYGDFAASAVGDTVTLPIVLASMPRKASCAAAPSEGYWQLPVQYSAGVTPTDPVTSPADDAAPPGGQRR